jgi:hypothetical protein
VAVSTYQVTLRYLFKYCLPFHLKPHKIRYVFFLVLVGSVVKLHHIRRITSITVQAWPVGLITRKTRPILITPFLLLLAVTILAYASSFVSRLVYTFADGTYHLLIIQLF